MESLPAILDIRDDLSAARAETDRDVQQEFDGILDRLAEFAERDRTAAREGILDEIDNELLRIEELLSGEAARRVRAARNRIQLYRESLSRSNEGLTVVDTTIRADDDTPIRTDDEEVVPMDARTEDVRVSATVVNDDDARTVTIAVTFYDAESTELAEVTGEPATVGEGEQATIEASTTVPEAAAYYTVTPLDEQSITGTGA